MQQLSLLPEPPQPPPKPQRETQDQMLNRLVAEVIATCEAQGGDPRLLVLEFKYREVVELLSHYTQQEAGQFVARLFDVVFRD